MRDPSDRKAVDWERHQVERARDRYEQLFGVSLKLNFEVSINQLNKDDGGILAEVQGGQGPCSLKRDLEQRKLFTISSL